MTEQEFKSAVEYLKEYLNECGIVIYAVMKSSDESSIKKMNIETNSLSALKTMFVDELFSMSQKEELQLKSLSTADERKDVMYHYDLEVPSELDALIEVTGSRNYPMFTFGEDDLSEIKAMVVEIGNSEFQVTLYKSIAAINIFRRSSTFLGLQVHESRFEKIEEEFLRLTSNFQLIGIDREILVTDLAALEKQFGFRDVIVREAKKGLDAIDAFGILENIEVLQESSEDFRFARKLTKVERGSPVLRSGISHGSIVSFCKNFPSLRGKIKFNSEETKIRLDTKISQQLFIKLLMDDYLISELTKIEYAALAKDTVTL